MNREVKGNEPSKEEKKETLQFDHIMSWQESSKGNHGVESAFEWIDIAQAVRKIH